MRGLAMKTEFASVKLARPFVAWLKREAARRGVPMYELVEELVSRGQKRFWQPEHKSHVPTVGR